MLCYIVITSYSIHYTKLYEPAHDAVGADRVAQVLDQQDQAGEEEAHRHPGQQHARAGEIPLQTAEAVDQENIYRTT